ncbi:L-threonine aldolase [Bifidobacterium bohemicum]|uniref:Threonine aldolase n=1 Tax=Bifidobacterium bohemicum DSM 22767 TaxID=1437606 RepID=A0A086ZFX5_9BIFI|nr:aminotransferase class I/II-fold pyridoxal phosphate-dependent enzyme [Bifidobacterium bohemicum]KFI45425.1 Threonine aldolase [Bifidobacterium bohemicum DSM 22767]SCB73165.1 L-threonine aldolase [Bifidobacterium bohemicum]
MLNFVNDYSEGADPSILKRLAETNMDQLPGYGGDEYTAHAKKRIRQACGCPEADVWFLVGGTQTNQTVIDTITPRWAGVVAATNGHVNVHEAGAIESTGHKVLTVPGHEGKLDPDRLDRFCADFYADGNYEHMVFPGAVYISHPTEYGTLYSKAELEAIAKVAHRYDMPLFLDGARLGYGLAAEGTDVTLEDIARITDVFYIGGTKVGALFGEAVVFTKGNTPKHFLTLIKQHGALLAKGWLLGLQFDTLFTDDLYIRIARNANNMAAQIRTALDARGYRRVYHSTTNQTFIVMSQPTIDRLSEGVGMGFLEKYDDTRSVMRICTSWATTQGHVDQLISLL